MTGIRNRIIGWSVVALFGLAGILAFVFVGAREEPWFASPTAIRVMTDWDQVLAPALPAPARPFAHSPVTISHQPNAAAPEQLVFEFDPSQQTTQQIPISRAGGGLAILTPDGAVFRLEAVAVSIPSRAVIQSNQVRVPVDWVDPLSHQPVQVERLRSDQGVFKYHPGDDALMPRAKFLIRVENVENARWLDFRIYNATHHGRLTYNWGVDDDPLVLRTEFRQWHDSPILLVVDIAYGAFDVRSLRTVPGSIVTFPSFDVKSLHTEPHFWRQSGRRHGGGSAAFRFRDRDRRGTGHFVGLSISPGVFVKVCDFEAPGGTPFEGWEHHHGLGILGLSVQDPPRFDEITIRARPQMRRLVFEIPSLPNLPKLTPADVNLFDHPIPFLYADERPEQLLEAIEAATQHHAYWGGDSSGVSKSKAIKLENVTAREVIEILRQESGRRPGVTINPKKETIQIGAEPDHFWERWFDWLDDLF